MSNQEYLTMLFLKSMMFKDRGLLKSALECRVRAVQHAAGDEGRFALAKANEAVLLAHHIGNGTDAYSNAQDCLERLDALIESDAEWQDNFGFSPALDVFQFCAYSSKNYEESIKRMRLIDDYNLLDSAQVQKNIASIKEADQLGYKWWNCQRGFARSFASRESQDKDNGQYPAAMSILDCILARGLRQDKGYDMSADEMFDVLDDMIAFSLQAYNAIYQKFCDALAKDPSLGQTDAPSEQYVIFKKPLEHWLELMPDFPAKWRPTFESYYRHFMNSPFPIHPQLMKRIGDYFKGISVEKQTCPKCGHVNSVQTPICVRCKYPFKQAPKKSMFGRLFGR